MQITTISLMLGQTKNLGDFNNAKIEASASAMIEAGEDIAISFDALRALLIRQLDGSTATKQTAIAEEVQAKAEKAVKKPAKKTEAPKEEPAPVGMVLITDADLRTTLSNIARQYGDGASAVITGIIAEYGVNHSSKLPMEHREAFLAKVKAALASKPTKTEAEDYDL